MQVDEQSYWLQPWLGDPVIRVPRDRDTRWVRDGYPCPGWLFGERDDQLYCAEELADEQLEITAVDKSGSSAPSRVAHLPNDNGGRFGRHMSTAHQGPLLVGERVLQAIATGFVSAELDGDGSLEFIELGYRPACAVARGEHVAWLAVEDGHALFSGEYPLSAIHHEYGRAPWLGLPHANEPERRLACPAWAGESLLLPVHKGETMDLLRLNEHQQFTLVEGIALDLNELFGDGDLAWWYVRGQGLWWIDATSHGPVDAGDLFAAELTASGGALAWMNNAHAGCGVHVSDAYAGPTAWR